MTSRTNLPMYHGASAKLFLYAQEMRDNPTKAEKAMWDILNVFPFVAYKFRRQHPIAAFIADFYSHSLKMVIEVDGEYHIDKDQKNYDAFRDEDMQALNISVIRFTNTDVLNKPSWVSEKIKAQIESTNTTLNP